VGRKDLSRTVIEGGRYYRNCYERRASHGTARARLRDWLDNVDDPDASDPAPLDPVPRSFRDKLRPAMRWIDAQVGRSWAKVRAELHAKFDARTIAGQHVLHDHMLGEVFEGGLPTRIGWGNRSYADWYVDAQGILRRTRYLGRTSRELARDVEAWRGARRATLRDGAWWWFDRVATGQAPNIVVRYVSARRMTKAERRYLDRLPPWARALVVQQLVVVPRR